MPTMPTPEKPNVAISAAHLFATLQAVTRSSVSGSEARNRRNEASATPHLAVQMDGTFTASKASSPRLVWTMEALLERLPVSRSTVYRWIEQDGLPVVRVGEGSRPYFLPETVIAWLQSREQVRSAATQPTRLDARAAAEQLRLAELRRTAARPRSRRTPPPPIAAAGSRERLRRIRGAH